MAGAAIDHYLFRTDLKNLDTCLNCTLPECGYVLPRYLSQCPIARLETESKVEAKKRWRAGKKAQLQAVKEAV